MYLRPVRTTQPQGPARLDPASRFYSRLIAVLDPISRRDLVTGRPLTIAGNFPLTSGKFGRSAQGDAASLGYIAVSGLGAEISMLGVMNNATCTSTGSLEFGLGSSAGNQLAAYQANNNPNNRFLLRQTNGGGISTIEFSANGRTAGTYVVGASFIGSDGNQIITYFNGRDDRGSVLNGSSGTNAVFDRFCIGGLSRSTNSFAQVGDDCALSVLFRGALSAAEFQSLSDNPWQLFASDSKSLWTPAAASVTLPTLVQPTSTTTPGAWTATGAGSLHAAINEAIPSGAEYISVNSASTCEFVLAESAHPGTANQTLAYRASSTAGSTLTVTLKQGATTIMTRTHSLTATDTLYTQTLTVGEIASIIAGPISVTLTTS